MCVQGACIGIVILLSPSFSSSLCLMVWVQLHMHHHHSVIVIASLSFSCHSHGMPWVQLHTHQLQHCPCCPLIMVANATALTQCYHHFHHVSCTTLVSTSQERGPLLLCMLQRADQKVVVVAIAQHGHHCCHVGRSTLVSTLWHEGVTDIVHITMCCNADWRVV